MTATPNPGGNVYHRDAPEDLHKAWNAAIRKVNDERANPPEDTNCEALDPIDEVEADHIWTKGDVEDIRVAIDEMCEYAWIEDLEYWKDAILTEIEEALDREWGGWGDEDECCKEECVPNCPNAVPGGESVETYLGSYTITACYPCGTCDDCQVDAGCCDQSEIREVTRKGFKALVAMSEWKDFHQEYCVLVEEVEDLEEEVEQLEEQLAALEAIRDEECAKPLPNYCHRAQAAVDEKQAELDAKQAELDEKITERDEKKAEADAKESEADAAAVESMAMARDCLPKDSPFFYGDAAGNEPWPMTACDELAPDCLNQDVDRCGVGWMVLTKTWQHFWWGWVWEGNWRVQMYGFYTRSGQPYVTSVRGCTGVPGYACVSCGPSGGCEYECGGNYDVIEVRARHRYPDTTPSGEECCDE